MAEFLSPGVFIEELPSQVQTIQGVSTSNCGIVGFTTRGPTNQAILVSSYDRFVQVFGDTTRDSITPLSAAAYFANGGRRLYVVRIVPGDAVASDGRVQSQHDDVTADTGAAATALSGTLDTNVPVGGTNGDTPLVPFSVNLDWRAAGTPQGTGTGVGVFERDGTTALVGDAILTAFEGRVVTGLPTIDTRTFAIDPTGTITIYWTDSLAAPLTISPTVTGFTATGTLGVSPNDSTFTIDLRTGFFTFEANGTATPAVGALLVEYTPTVVKSATDDGAGAWAAASDTTGGAIDYWTGIWTATADVAVPTGVPVLASYQIDAWDLDPVSEGTWGNDMRLEIFGNQDNFTASTGQYTKFDVYVRFLNSGTLAYDIVEPYDELVFDDSTDAKYFPDVLNDLGDYINIGTASGDEAPQQLQANGSYVQIVAAGGDGASTGVATIDTNGDGNDLLNVPVQPRSVAIDFTSGGTAYQITDNGAGDLIGDVDPAGTNTIDYDTGEILVTLGDGTTAVTPDVGTFVAVTYYAAPDETYIVTLGDQTKYYADTAVTSALWTAGDNGTFDATEYGRSQVSSFAALGGNFEGLYALSRVRDLMQVVLPDWVGDTTITQDLIDYCDARTSNPEGGDRFCIVQAPYGYSAQQTVDWLRFTLLRSSKYAAMYWPWLKVPDPSRDNRNIAFPAVTHIAGIYARTDADRTVAKAPGGTVDGAIRFATELEVAPERGEMDILYPAKINPLIQDPSAGLAVWGVRTLSPQSEWRWINVVRVFMFVERSVYNSTQWVVFENNNPTLWSRIQAQISGFLRNLYNNGYFAGQSPSQAYRVVCDSSNNTDASINLGQVICDVGIAPNKPAEFCRFRFTQRTLSS